jgi:hypothetical protein
VRNGLAAVVLAAAAITLAVLQLPVTAGVQPAADPDAVVEPHRRWVSTPPRLVPTSPTAVAVPATGAPQPTSTTTSAPPATTTTAPTTTAAAIPRPDRIRALVDFPFEQVAPAWQISFEAASQDGLLGIADQELQVIRVYVRADESDAALAFTLAHEMAHALDALHVTPDERDEYRSLRGMPQSLDWLWEWDGGSSGDFVMPAGDFAESFAVATTGETSDWASDLGPPPSTAVQQRVVAMATEG